MTMLGAGLIILLVAFGSVGLLWVLPAWRGYKGKRIVTCPDSQKPAVVEIDSARVAASAWGGPPDLRLKDCSRWPAKSDCGRECLGEVARA
ncbi:MAG: hypothetical protein ABI584_01930 [Acidobacteriota bacterium]